MMIDYLESVCRRWRSKICWSCTLRQPRTRRPRCWWTCWPSQSCARSSQGRKFDLISLFDIKLILDKYSVIKKWNRLKIKLHFVKNLIKSTNAHKIPIKDLPKRLWGWGPEISGDGEGCLRFRLGFLSLFTFRCFGKWLVSMLWNSISNNH